MTPSGIRASVSFPVVTAGCVASTDTRLDGSPPVVDGRELDVGVELLAGSGEPPREAAGAAEQVHDPDRVVRSASAGRAATPPDNGGALRRHLRV